MNATIRRVSCRRGLVTVTMALSLLLSLATASHAQPSSTKVAGAGAGFLGPGGSYDSYLSVEIVRPQNTVWLRYLVTVGNVQCTGEGLIPTEAFSILGQSGRAFLEVDTTTLPEFTAFRCVTAPDGSYECTPDAGGVIRMEWVGNGAYREENLTQRRMFYADQQRPSGQHIDTWVVSASARGVMLGYEFESPPGDALSASVSSVAERLR